MPIYEYKCSICNLKFDRISKIGEKNIKCPNCSSPEVTKLISKITENKGHSCSHNCNGCSCD